tara:strand:- start:10861 stop:12474 length:1614 start_codon:yes stop_codon:yes gene_type:complete
VPKLVARQPPPPDYYADNVRQLMGHVQRHYGDLLQPDEQSYLHGCQRLSPDALRLFARLLGRKGPWVRIDRLRYPEVVDLDCALRELQAATLVEINGPVPADGLLGLLTQKELLALFPSVSAAEVAGKAQRVAHCISSYPDELIVRQVARQYPWVCVARYQVYFRLQVLFFGDARQDLSTFVLRDLGLSNYEPYELCRSQRQFAARTALDLYLRLLALASLARRGGEIEAIVPHVLRELTACHKAGWPSRLHQRVAAKILNRLGRRYERQGDVAGALACYEDSTLHPARERRVRLLKGQGRDSEAATLIASIQSEPWSAAEQDFAERFGIRARCDIPTTRVPLARPSPPRVEQHAIEELARQGDRAWHVENALPLSLAGLAYWPVIFTDAPGAFVNPFQLAPVDLFWDDFCAARQTAMGCREEQLASGFARTVRATFNAKRSISNRLVHWGVMSPELLDALLEAVPESQLHRLARYALENLPRARVGFPDLFVVGSQGGFEFVEVKGPTDQLQPAQRVWFKALQGLSMPARMLKYTA